MTGVRRLLTIGHSYVVAQNRRLADEMARQGGDGWSVTAGAPARLQGDLRPIELEPIANERCAVVALPMHGRNPHVRFYGRGLRRLVRQPWDVIHVWEEPYGAAAAQVAALALPGTLVVPATFQNIPKTYPPPFSWFERRVLRRSAAWIAFGETSRAALASRPGYRDRRGIVIPPGVDVDVFRPDAAAREAVRARIDGDPDVPLVGFVGRFVPEKGVRTLMAALAWVKRPWRAVFVGGGPLEAEIQRFCREHPGRARVVTGVTHDEMPAWLAALDLLCAPSRTTAAWREQFGRMLIEAMACGVPVLASPSGEIPHVVGSAAELVAEGDAAQWAARIDMLLASPGRRGELARAGLERVRARFSWPLVACAHLDLFDALLRSTRGIR